MTDQKPALRLAFRVEGEWWNAYAAEPETMNGALLLGSIRMAIVAKPRAKKEFMNLMRYGLKNLLATQGVKIEGWADTVPAPEHERSGSA